MHAVLITAYKDFDMLRRLLRRMTQDDVRCFVHIDSKAAISDAEFAALKQHADILPTRYLIKWGSYSHLRAIIDLMSMAIAERRITMVHIISGQDYPVRPLAHASIHTIYMQAKPFETENDMVRDRVYYRKFFHRLEGIRVLFRLLDRTAFHLQRLLGIRRKRTPTYEKIYKGLVWMSLPADACRYALESPRARRYLDELRSFYVPEEFFVQTVLMNSDYNARANGDNLRFMKLELRYNERPAILDASDAPQIFSSNALFARKLDTRYSVSLADMLDENYDILAPRSRDDATGNHAPGGQFSTH